MKAYIKPLPAAASLLLKELLALSRIGLATEFLHEGLKKKITTFFWEQAIILHHLTWVLQMSGDVGFSKAMPQK